MDRNFIKKINENLGDNDIDQLLLSLQQPHDYYLIIKDIIEYQEDLSPDFDKELLNELLEYIPQAMKTNKFLINYLIEKSKNINTNDKKKFKKQIDEIENDLNHNINRINEKIIELFGENNVPSFKNIFIILAISFIILILFI